MEKEIQKLFGLQIHKGRFFLSWIPSPEIRNNVIDKNGKKYPGNKHLGSFGGDSYDISGVVGGGGSKGSVTWND